VLRWTLRAARDDISRARGRSLPHWQTEGAAVRRLGSGAIHSHQLRDSRRGSDHRDLAQADRPARTASLLCGRADLQRILRIHGGRAAVRSTRGARHRSEHGTSDRKSTRLNSSHSQISYAVFCLKKKNKTTPDAYPTLTQGFPERRARRMPSHAISRCEEHTSKHMPPSGVSLSWVISIRKNARSR